MEDKLKNKKVPMDQLDEYLELHRDLIVCNINKKNRQKLDKAGLESLLPSCFLELRDAISKILKDNDILGSEEE